MDAAGRSLRVSEWGTPGSPGRFTVFTYEEFGLPETITAPDGMGTSFDHGGVSRVDWTDHQTVAIHGMQRPLELSAENGLGQQQYTTGTYAYDGAGNVTAMGADTFSYDAHNRLSGATIDGETYSYAYDAYGNLSTLTRPGEAISICIESQKNRIAETPPGGCSLIADQDYFGNVTQLQSYEYEYDALDMPIHRNPEPVPPEHTYVYTADEERIWFVNAGGGPPPGDGKTGLTAWEGLFLRDLDGKLLRQYSKETSSPFVPADAVYTAPFTVSRDYIHRNGQLAVIRIPAGGIRHHHLDHLGTPRAISAGNGALVSTHKYSPYGKEIGGSSGNALQFTGHERDSHGAGEADNLDYMHARFYSPYVGRFLSTDPVESSIPSKPQAWNRFAYLFDNSLKWVDPDGQCAAPAGLGEGQVGICIEAFIAAKRIGGFGFGDARTFAPNDPEATARLSYKSIIDPGSGRVLRESLKPGVSEVGLLTPIYGRRGTAEAAGGSAPTESGTRFSILFSGKSGFSGLPFAPKGSIGFHADFTIDSEGNVTRGEASATRGYPSIEGYAYRIVQGELVIQVIFRFEEKDPRELTGPIDEPLRE